METPTPILEKSLNGGTQQVYRFDNNYGALVVNHSFSNGLELAVIKFDGDDWHLDYTTGITEDVIGHNTQHRSLVPSTLGGILRYCREGIAVAAPIDDEVILGGERKTRGLSCHAK